MINSSVLLLFFFTYSGFKIKYYFSLMEKKYKIIMKTSFNQISKYT